MWAKARSGALLRVVRSLLPAGAPRRAPGRPNNFFSLHSPLTLKRAWASAANYWSGQEQRGGRGRRLAYQAASEGPLGSATPARPRLAELLPRSLYSIDYSTLYTLPGDSKAAAWAAHQAARDAERARRLAQEGAGAEQARVRALQARVDGLFGAAPQAAPSAPPPPRKSAEVLLEEAMLRIAALESQVEEERRKAKLFAEAMHIAQSRARGQESDLVL